MNGLPEAVVQDLSIFKARDSSCCARRPRRAAYGKWTRQLDGARRCRTCGSIAPTPDGCCRRRPAVTCSTVTRTNPTHWDDSPDVVIDIGRGTGGDPVGEADLIAPPTPRLRAPVLLDTR